MKRLTCDNKRCKHEFYSSEDKKIIKCPVCNADVYNMDKIITVENALFIETIIKNLKIYNGEKGIMQAIDKVYHDPIQRIRVRQLYMTEINKLKSEV